VEAELRLEMEAAATGGHHDDSVDDISDLDLSGDEDFEDIGDMGGALPSCLWPLLNAAYCLLISYL
jgi:hypothetical protein